MNLYILISDGGDGSYYPRFTLNSNLVDKLQEAHDLDLMTYENGVGCDGDGFHYSTINAPDGSTAESLGINPWSMLTNEYADRFFEGLEDDEEDCD